MIIPIQQKYNLDDPLQKLAHVTQLRLMSTPPSSQTYPLTI
jgi:hypothetical protein